VPTAATTVPTAATEAAADISGLTRSAGQIAKLLGGGQQQPPAAAPINRPPQGSASDNPMLASMFNAPQSTSTSMSAPMTVPISSGPSMMPAAVGIGSLPMGGQQPMSNDMMLAGMSPDQSSMVNQYLRSRNMVGFV
jgi:hypothetical protein